MDFESFFLTEFGLSTEAPRIFATQQFQPGLPQMRTNTPQGAPIILTPRMPVSQGGGMMGGPPPPLVSPSEAATTGLMYNPYEYPYSALQQAAILEYPGSSLEQSAMGMFPIVR